MNLFVDNSSWVRDSSATKWKDAPESTRSDLHGVPAEGIREEMSWLISLGVSRGLPSGWQAGAFSSHLSWRGARIPMECSAARMTRLTTLRLMALPIMRPRSAALMPGGVRMGDRFGGRTFPVG